MKVLVSAFNKEKALVEVFSGDNPPPYLACGLMLTRGWLSPARLVLARWPPLELPLWPAASVSGVLASAAAASSCSRRSCGISFSIYSNAN